MGKANIEILLSNDDKSDRLLFVEALGDLELDPVIHIVKNGFKLMELLESLDEKIPDALFLDLNMPGKNGIECLTDIRSDKKYDPMAVIIYSTSSAAKDIDQTYELGANIYIPIPVDFNAMKSALAMTMDLLSTGKIHKLKKDEFVAAY